MDATNLGCTLMELLHLITSVMLNGSSGICKGLTFDLIAIILISNYLYLM